MLTDKQKLEIGKKIKRSLFPITSAYIKIVKEKGLDILIIARSQGKDFEITCGRDYFPGVF